MKPSTTPKKIKVTTNSSLLSRGVETKKRAETKLQGVGKKITSKVKTAVKERIQQQKNFDNRPNNKNYYGKAKSFK